MEMRSCHLIVCILCIGVTVQSEGNGGGYGQYEFKIRVDDNGDSKKMVIIRQIGENLNLTCQVLPVKHANQLDASEKTPAISKISWILPSPSLNKTRRISQKDGGDFFLLSISDLQTSDNGEYRCEAHLQTGQSIFRSIFVHVRRSPNLSHCGDFWFRCPLGGCIHNRFVCDGIGDCLDDGDEAPYLCGEDACEGKLNCDDGRCMPPDLCCFPQISPNCSSWNNAPCCAQLVNGYSASDARYQLDHDLNALQSTVLTTIGCVLALVFVVLCSIIGVCRINMRRSIMKYTSRHVRSYLNQHEHHHLSHPDVGLHLNPNTQSTFGNIIVTYNINNGVQLRGPAVNPPAYSEVVRLPLQDIPPPPYVSVEDVRHDPQAAQLLLEENNNGDINGNSVMSVEENNNHVMDRNHTSNIA